MATVPAVPPPGDRSDRWKNLVRDLVSAATIVISNGDFLGDSRMRGLQEGFARRWQVPPPWVLIGHHGAPVLSPEADLSRLPTEMRRRPELFLAEEDRRFRDGETRADYAERIAGFLTMAGLMYANDEGALRFAYPPRELDPTDDEVWDRYVSGDPATNLSLRMRPMSEVLGREPYNGAVLASMVDAEEYVEPAVQAWLTQVTRDLSAAAGTLTSTPPRLAQRLTSTRDALRTAGDDPARRIEVEADARATVSDFVLEYPALADAYLSLAVPLTRHSSHTPEQMQVEIDRARQYMVRNLQDRLAACRGDSLAMLGVCRAVLEELTSRVDGAYEGDGPRYQRIPMGVVREYIAALADQKYARREMGRSGRLEGVSLPWG